ncbi:hypothetical protein BC941DRAFT_434637, partial [Chlamydoabsidia padenii]
MDYTHGVFTIVLVNLFFTPSHSITPTASNLLASFTPINTQPKVSHGIVCLYQGKYYPLLLLLTTTHPSPTLWLLALVP